MLDYQKRPRDKVEVLMKKAIEEANIKYQWKEVTVWQRRKKKKQLLRKFMIIV